MTIFSLNKLPIERTADDESEEMDTSTEQPLNNTPHNSRPTSRASKRNIREDDPDETPTKPPSKKPTTQTTTFQPKLPPSVLVMQRPIKALIISSNKPLNRTPPTQDSPQPGSPNPFQSQDKAIPSQATSQTTPAHQETANQEPWITSPPPLNLDTYISRTSQYLQFALDAMRKAEEDHGEIEWPSSLYEKIKDICEVRSTDKRKVAISLGHLGGSDLLIELTKQNTLLTETLLSMMTTTPSQPPPTRHPSQAANPHQPKETYAAAACRPMLSQTGPKPAQQKPATAPFHKGRAILRFDPPWPHYKRLTSQELTAGLNEALDNSDAPKTLRVKAATYTKGGHLAVHAIEPATGEDLIRCANHLTTYALTRYPGRTESTTCEAQPDIVYHRIQLNRAPTRDYASRVIESGQDLLDNLISSNREILSKDDFAELPKWAVSREKLEQLYRAPIVISLKSEELAAKIKSRTSGPIFFQGTMLTPAFYRQRAPIRQCKNCNSYKHKSDDCRETTSCAICAQKHSTTDHKCDLCEATMLPCEHIPAKCVNCEESHTADDRRCEARAEAIREAKAENPKADLNAIGNPNASQQNSPTSQTHRNGDAQGGHKRRAKRTAPKNARARKSADSNPNAEGGMEVEQNDKTVVSQ